MQPNIWIWVSVKNERFYYNRIKINETLIEGPNGSPIKGPRISEVNRIEQKMRKSLKKLGKVVKHKNKSPKIQRFLEDLQGNGKDLYETLFRNLTKKISDEFKVLLKKSIWQTKSGYDPILIEVESRSDCNFPLEYAFLQPEDSDSPDIKKFLGLAFLINYVTPYQRFFNLELENIPKLPMKLFINDDGSQSCRDEIKFFEDNKDHFDFCIPWTTKEEIQDFPDRLSELISRVDLTCYMGFRNVPDQIHHFRCDLKGVFRNDENCKLRFSYGNEATIDELTQHCSSLISGLSEDRPFVFFITSRRSKLCRINRNSILRFLLKISRGFIFTDGIVPELFCTEFSKRFYRYILQKKTLGYAL